MTTDWSSLYAARTARMRSSAIRELLKLTQQPDIISFAGGLPAPELFPTERVMQATQTVLEQRACQALQYSTTEGYPALREMVTRQFSRYELPVTADDVLITAGSQQGLDLIGRIMLDPGDRVLVEAPTYLGALQAWNAYEAEFATIPTDQHGMRTDLLAGILSRERVKFIYALPNFQNPTGRTLPEERREELVEVAARFGVPIVEDDPYGQLRYDGESLIPLIALDARQRESLNDGNVLYLGTFSKTLCPGFRVAWTVGPRAVIGRMVQGKQGSDLHTSTFAQMVAYETARGGYLETHVRTLRGVYRERRDLMLRLMEKLFPPGVQWTRPEGGLFLWVTLPEGMDAAYLLEKAVESRVAFVPGSAFFPQGGGENTFRMNFSNATPRQIAEGIKRLAAVLTAELVQLPA